jgi:WD40 repeat protein
MLRNYLAVSDGSSSVELRDDDTGALIKSVSMGYPHRISWMRFSSDAMMLAVVFNDFSYEPHPLQVWNIETETLVAEVGPNERFVAAVFNNTGERIMTRDMSSGLSVWDTISGELVLKLAVNNNSIPQFSMDGQLIFTSRSYQQGDDQIVAFDSTTGEETMSMNGHRGPILQVAVSPLGSSIVSSALNEMICWDLKTRSVRHRISALPSPPFYLTYFPDGIRVVVCYVNTINIVNTDLGNVMSTIVSHQGFHTMAMNSHGTRIHWTSVTQGLRWIRTYADVESGIIDTEHDCAANSVICCSQTQQVVLL